MECSVRSANTRSAHVVWHALSKNERGSNEQVHSGELPVIKLNKITVANQPIFAIFFYKGPSSPA